MTASVWTLFLDARLRKLVSSGRRNEEIAETMGMTRGAVIKRKHRLGLRQPPREPLHVLDEIARRYKRGETTGRIAVPVGLHARRVSYLVRRIGAVDPVRTIARFRPLGLDETLVRLDVEGLTATEIGTAVGMPHTSVTSRLRTLARYEAAIEAMAEAGAAGRVA